MHLPDGAASYRASGRTGRPCYRSKVATNQIREVTLRPVAPDDGEAGHALFMALEVGEPSRLLGFLEDVITRFKAERGSGPPDTQFMLITVVGDVSAEAFVHAWQSSTADDPRARALLGMMHQADVMQGDAGGRIIGQASLLAPSAP